MDFPLSIVREQGILQNLGALLGGPGLFRSVQDAGEQMLPSLCVWLGELPGYVSQQRSSPALKSCAAAARARLRAKGSADKTTPNHI